MLETAELVTFTEEILNSKLHFFEHWDLPLSLNLDQELKSIYILGQLNCTVVLTVNKK